MTTEPHLLATADDGVLELTLNRPAARNAISPEMVCRLADAWRAAEEDDGIRVVVVAANGPAFSAGADVRLLVPLLSGERAPADAWDRRLLDDPSLGAAAFAGARTLSKPVIAAVNGPATGGGFELVLGTDLRVAADGARFGLTEVKLGLVPGGGGVALLPRQVPAAIAAELLLTGELMSAERAAAFGLVNRVVPADELADAVRALAHAVAGNGPLAVRLVLEAMRNAQQVSVEEALAHEAAAFAVAVASEDAREGARAFAEKRAPRFVGR